MRNSDPYWAYSALPSTLQVILAAVTGVCIGLVIVGIRQPVSSRAALSQKSFPTQLTGAFNNFAKVLPGLDRRMTVLLMGVDSNGRHTERFLNTRSDTMAIISLDPYTKKVGVVSIPRDSRVNLASHHGIDKINAAHAFGGPELAVRTTQEAFGVYIDRYIVIDARGLKKLFQVLGPVEVVVEKKLRYRDRAARLNVALDPGVQTLDAEQIEQYVRFRHDARGDLGRIERQQWFLRQMVNKFKEPQVLLKLPDLFNVAREYVVTNLSIDEMARIASFAKDIQPHQIETATLPGRAECIDGGSYWLPDMQASALVLNRITGTPISSAIYTDTLDGQAAYASSLSEQNQKPISVVLKYPKGKETVATHFEAAITNAGYVVRYKIRTDISDCQHEQIIQNSLRADDQLTLRLRHTIPDLKNWATAVSLDLHSPTDFTLVLTPSSDLPIARELVKAANDKKTGKI